MALDHVWAWLLACLAYGASRIVFQRCRQHVLALPVFVAVLLVLAVCAVVGLAPSDFAARTQGLRSVMDLAVVAMAVPLHQACRRMGPLLKPFLVGLAVASVVSVVGVLAAGWLLDVPWLVSAAVAPKAATLPVALTLGQRMGANPTLVVTAVLVTGVSGTLLVPRMLRWLGVLDERIHAFTLGVSAHAIGLIRAQADYPDHRDLAVAGMCANALLTTLVCLCLPL